MPIAQVNGVPWTRKHDEPGVPLFSSVPKIVYPLTLQELIELCFERKPAERLKAAGSHWALSPAAISDSTFIETNDPNNVFPVMGRTLREVVPNCLTNEALDFLGGESDPQFYFVHVETGKRVCQLYAELDAGDDANGDSLARYVQKHYKGNKKFLGPWAFQTLGGAGGQTVFGALTTGTHGGDFRLPPIADSVKALHLVTDGGLHYWIEPTDPSWLSPVHGVGVIPFTADDKLRDTYGTHITSRPFEIIRDDDVFNAVLMSAGRFGVVYSIVLQAVKPYNLHETRELGDWQDVKHHIAETHNTTDLYNKRFLQIVVNVAPHANGTRNRCGITKRESKPLLLDGLVAPRGRAERVGDLVSPQDSRLRAPFFRNAGNSHPYDSEGSAGFLVKACSNASFIDGVVEEITNEIKDLIETNKVAIGGGLAAVAVLGGGPAALAALIPWLALILVALLAFRELLKHVGPKRLGQAMDELRNTVLNQSTPEGRAAGVFVWRAISLKVFEQEQAPRDYEAISYAVMDLHDYLDKSCQVNVDSVEVFFDATSSNLIAFIDRVLKFERDQEFEGKACVGYIALRFTAATNALIGPQRYELTCAVEIAALKDVQGSGELVAFATTLSLDKNINGILHWGQRNDSTMADIEHRFGDSLVVPNGLLQRWRAALSRLSDNGRLDGFSSSFTRRVGLEIVTPIIDVFSARVTSDRQSRSIIAQWNCRRNPPNTVVSIDVVSPSDEVSHLSPLELVGEQNILVAQTGDFTITLLATVVLNSESRHVTKVVVVHVN